MEIIQGRNNFLSLSSGLVIKRHQFDELPAPDSVIKRVVTLAKNNGVSPNLLFLDQYKASFDWPDNESNNDGLDPTPLADYSNVTAEMPGVLIDRTTLLTVSSSNSCSNEPDWSQLLDEATMNADLDFTNHLPPPPEVIKSDNDNNVVFIPSPNLDISPSHQHHSSLNLTLHRFLP